MKWEVPAVSIDIVCHHLIAHPHRAFDDDVLLLPQQSPQPAPISSCLHIPLRKALAQEGGTHSLSRDPSPLPKPTKQKRDATLGEGKTRLREEEVILAGTPPLEALRRPRTVFIPIREQ